jgi:DNA-binding SARP family transcriptional activator
VRFGILGPLEVTGDDGRPVAVAGVKERALLALLPSTRAGWSRPTG